MLGLIAAKKAIIDKLVTLTDVGQALEGVQVAYSLPPDPQRLCVYGGGARYSGSDAVEESGLMVREVDTVELVVRVYAPGDDVRAVEESVETIAKVIVTVLDTTPNLAGTNSALSVASAVLDPPMVAPGPEPGVTSNLRLLVGVQGLVTP